MSKEKMEYYSLDRIKTKRARYNMIFGERSNGKTYAVLNEILKNYIDRGEQGALIRRMSEDFKGKNGSAMCANLVANEKGENMVEKYSGGMWNNIKYYGSRWYLEKVTVNSKGEYEHVVDETPFLWAFAISAQEHDKSSSYPHIKTILFDEFITRGFYLNDEFVLFSQVLSTIIRNRDDVIIYMCGNTINKYCPYFKEMGLNHVTQMKQGDIEVYEYGDSGLRVAVEFSGSPKSRYKKSNVYFAFDNPKLHMIKGTGDVWELDIYPHCPCKYRRRDIVFTYFIQFSGNLLQADVVSTDGSLFTYIHRKTTPLQSPKTDLVYSPEISHLPNKRRRITKPVDEIDKVILQMFISEKVFYQDNEVGDITKNYLLWCKS